jgi:hypothetical protein
MLFSISISPSLLLLSLIVAATTPLIVYRLKRNRKKRLKTEGEIWSIGIYEGPSPTAIYPHAGIKNPVLSAQDVTDVNARFVADPFMVKQGGKFHLYFEVLNSKRNKGEIGYAQSSDLKNWKYCSIVLRERFHLSYPYVFVHDEELYMLPECAESNEIRLYKSIKSPDRWDYVSTLIRSKKRYPPLLDPSICNHEGRWYLFSNARMLNNLHLFTASTLSGPWVEHPQSPIVVASIHYARPGGRIVRHNGQLYRFSQDGAPRYGSKVWAFRITELSVNSYSEELIPDGPVIQAGSEAWQRNGMHTVDAHQQENGQWIVLVDGLEEQHIF